jgi:hypothetical protein
VRRYDMDGHVRIMQRMVRRLIISILNYCVTNLFNSVLQKKCTGVEPHYFVVWEPAHQGNVDAVERQVTISSYSYEICVMFIPKSIVCRTDIRRS